MNIKLGNKNYPLNEKICHQAHTWLDTDFHLGGRMKKNNFSKGGCDCIGLIAGVLNEVNYCINGLKIQYYDCIDYRDLYDPELQKLLLNKIQQVFHCKSFNHITDTLYIGQIACFEILPGCYHMAFIVPTEQNILYSISENNQQNLSIIHSCNKIGKVIKQNLDRFWLAKIKYICSLYNF